MSGVECAVSWFKEGFNCSQALLATYGLQLGINSELALKVSSAFGGGMARMGETCGAVTGAFMVIGLKYGKTRASENNDHSKEKTYCLANEFVAKFRSRNGSIICRELLHCDISTPEGMQLAKKKNLMAVICPKLIRDAAEIIEEIL